MATGGIKRVKRLVSFREVERKKAGGEVAQKKSERDLADEEAKLAKRQVEEELEEVVQHAGRAFSVDDMTIALGCLEVAKEEAQAKSVTLKQSEEELNKHISLLLAKHRQVKQIETLFDTLRKRHQKDMNLKEQSEIDDLSAIKEAR